MYTERRGWNGAFSGNRESTLEKNEIKNGDKELFRSTLVYLLKALSYKLLRVLEKRRKFSHFPIPEG